MATKIKPEKRIAQLCERITLPDGRRGIFFEMDTTEIKQYKITITKQTKPGKRTAKPKSKLRWLINSLEEIERIKESPNYKETHSLDKFLED